MAVKRYYAKKDNTITNAFKENLTTRGTSSNMGFADILEVFSIYGQASTSSTEQSRFLVKFDCTASTNSIKSDRDAGVIPASGSVNFYLRMFNAPHSQTLPKSYTMDVSAISGGWTEGTGMDMEGYKDIGESNWVNRIASRSAGDHAWSSTGGDYFSDTSSSFTASFDTGVEDIELDITTLVEQWVSSSNLGQKEDEGVGVFLSSTYSSAARSYYTKKFFARGTEFFYKKPHIEARWDSSTEDDRGNFYYSSSLATAGENLNTIYFYNYFRGRLRNIPSIGTGTIRVSFFSGSTEPTSSAITLVADGTHVLSASPTVVTGNYVSTGIYSATVALTAAATPLQTIFDVWFSGSDSVTDATTAVQFGTGSIKPKKIYSSTIAPTNDYTISITNLRGTYSPAETARLRIYTRQKDWSPTIYTKAVSTPEVEIAESGSYEIYRVIDDLKVIPHGTGSTPYHTLLSYDASGSYFDLDMSMFEIGYMHAIKLAFYNQDIGSWVEQSEIFKFKVE
tara:strand:+ start:1272 stop:2795 length:1524 start_codon:yes stop_codon:yes gene_type:complete